MFALVVHINHSRRKLNLTLDPVIGDAQDVTHHTIAESDGDLGLVVAETGSCDVDRASAH